MSILNFAVGENFFIIEIQTFSHKYITAQERVL